MQLAIEDVKRSECFQIIFQNIRTFTDKFCINFDALTLTNSHVY